jgi:hypothetical protein
MVYLRLLEAEAHHGIVKLSLNNEFERDWKVAIIA